MPAGFQFWVEDLDDVIQLADDEQFFSLFEKGVETDAQSWSQEGNNSGYRDVVISSFSTSDAPMMAVRSDSGGTWCSLIDTANGDLTYRIFRTGSGDVEWYLFAKKAPSLNASNLGLELWDENGNLVFASDMPPARPVGIYSDSGYSGLPLTGRKLAHAPMKEYRFSYRSITYAGIGSCQLGDGPAYQHYEETGWTRSAIAVGGSSVSESNRSTQFGPVPYACFNTPSPASFTNNSPPFRTLILDVTNY